MRTALNAGDKWWYWVDDDIIGKTDRFLIIP